MGHHDIDKLRAIGAEIQRLQDEGRWTEAQFQRLWAEGKAAANGQSGAMEFILASAAEDAWIEVLMG